VSRILTHPNAGTNSRSGSDLVAPFQDSRGVRPQDPDGGHTVRKVEKQVVFTTKRMHMHVAQAWDEEPAFPINHMRISGGIYIPAGSDTGNTVILDNDRLPFQDTLAVHGDDVHILEHDRCIHTCRYFFLGNTRFDPLFMSIGHVDVDRHQNDNNERNNDPEPLKK